MKTCKFSSTVSWLTYRTRKLNATFLFRMHVCKFLIYLFSKKHLLCPVLCIISEGTGQQINHCIINSRKPVDGVNLLIICSGPFVDVFWCISQQHWKKKRNEHNSKYFWNAGTDRSWNTGANLIIKLLERNILFHIHGIIYIHCILVYSPTQVLNTCIYK